MNHPKLMQKIILFILISFTVSVFAKEPLNLDFAKDAIINYYDSGQYDHDFSKAILQGKKYLQDALQKKHNKKLAIVFDIDETLVTTYYLSKENNFGNPKKFIIFELSQPKLPAIKMALELYNFAKENNMAVFLITGRERKLLKITTSMLHSAGYSGWKSLYLAPNGFQGHGKSEALFKTQIRKQIAEQGYDIVLNIGDQYSDLTGGYADRIIKLPNPFYFVR